MTQPPDCQYAFAWSADACRCNLLFQELTGTTLRDATDPYLPAKGKDVCGIVGFSSYCHGTADLEDMLQTLVHRGPDDIGTGQIGIQHFGVCRLAIVDRVGGRQPIWNEDGLLAIVFNGEVYNYQQLKSQLKDRHAFITNSDTEVVLHAYEEWGFSCFAHLNGMFGCGLLNGSRIILARDRLGEKPLYYYHRKDIFIFASEIKAIALKVDARCHTDDFYATFETSNEGETLFENICEVPPGCYLVYENGRSQIVRYWFPEDFLEQRNDMRSCQTEQSYVDEFRWLVTDAIKLRVPQEVPFACTVSGGVDSSIVASVCQSDTLLTSLVKLGPLYDEEDRAKILAKKLHANLVCIQPQTQDFANCVTDIVWHLDQPVTTLAALPAFMLAEKAKEMGIKVLISGLGADELLAGYVRHLAVIAWWDFLQTKQFAGYESLLRTVWGTLVSTDIETIYSKLVARSTHEQKALKYVTEIMPHVASPIQQMSVFDLRVTLPPLLRAEDRAAAHAGLENRSPFLDHRLVEYALTLPDHLKIRRSDGRYVTKFILQRAFRDLLPSGLVRNPRKVGYPSPVAAWLQMELAGIYSASEQWLRSYPELNRLVAYEHAPSRGEFDRKRWQVVQLGIWASLFLAKDDRETIRQRIADVTYHSHSALASNDA